MTLSTASNQLDGGLKTYVAKMAAEVAMFGELLFLIGLQY